LAATGVTDLHTHTTASDGSLTPEELVAFAAERGVAVLGITDHDTTEGLAAARGAATTLGVRVVDGIELNCDTEARHADVLGYLFDAEDTALQALLTTIRDVRERRAELMVERLKALGSSITFEKVAAVAGSGSVGRPHVAQVLVAEGFVPDVSAAFARYIGPGGPAYADRYRLAAPEACALIRRAGGVPVLAHPVAPHEAHGDEGRLRRFLQDLVDAGLGGLECFYSGYTAQVSRWLVALADHFALVPTGGSDFHGPWRVGRELGAVDVPPETVARLEAARR
jgi:predicted metal-dependent phosphoesterase TrpH